VTLEDFRSLIATTRAHPSRMAITPSKSTLEGHSTIDEEENNEIYDSGINGNETLSKKDSLNKLDDLAQNNNQEYET